MGNVLAHIVARRFGLCFVQVRRFARLNSKHQLYVAIRERLPYRRSRSHNPQVAPGPIGLFD